MSQEKKSTIAVIGCGLAANWAHIPALKAIPEADLVAVCDMDFEKARQVSSDFGIASAYGDVSEMLANESIDVVHITTHPDSHLDLTLQALEAGSNVLIEKPFVSTAEEADRAIAKATETGRRFTVIHNDVFRPSVIELKARIRAGEIGTITSVHFFSALRDQRNIAKPWYYEMYGGRIGETLPHAYCLLVDLVDGLEIKHVEAHSLGHSLTPDGVNGKDCGVDELHVQLWSQAQNAVGTIFYGTNSTFPDCLLVCGTGGHLMAHALGGVTQLPARDLRLGDSIEIASNFTQRVLRKLGLRRTTAAQKVLESSHYRQIRAFLLHLHEGAEYSVTEAKAREVVDLWERTVKAYA